MVAASGNRPTESMDSREWETGLTDIYSGKIN